MTRHALAAQPPEGAVFAVSSFGPALGDNRPPAELQPLGLEGPLGWVAEQLEARDRADMSWLWKLAPDDLCPARALPGGIRAPLSAVESLVSNFATGSKNWSESGGGAGCAGSAAVILAVGALAGWDLLAFHRAVSFEERRGRRTGRRAAMVGDARVASVPATVLAGFGAAGTTEARPSGRSRRRASRSPTARLRPTWTRDRDSSRTRRRNSRSRSESRSGTGAGPA